MTILVRYNIAGALAAALLAAAPAGAQGTLSSQGFGYPPGQLSARAQATGGGLGEFDGQSTLNPAALADWGRQGLFVQYAPERRSVKTAGGTDRTTLSRFPLIAGAVRVGGQGMIGVSVSTLFDRTWETSERITTTAGGEPATATLLQRSTGAINDIRVGGAWAPRPGLAIGLGVHSFNGANRRRRTLTFEDTASFDTYNDATNIDYSGKGVSAGVEWAVNRAVTVAASGRTGGSLRAYVGDTVISEASVPTRFGAGLRFTGIAGITLAGHAEWNGWSRLSGLDSSIVDPTDASRADPKDSWSFGAGAEVRGPRWFGSDVPLRLGVRSRTLPFAVGAGEVKELGVGGGLGLLFAGSRANMDITLEHLRRSAPLGLKERATTLAIGMSVRL